MTQPTLLLLVSFLSLIAGAALAWLALRNSATLSAAKARAEAGTELAVVQTQLRERATRIEALEKSVEAEQQARIAAENNAAALVARLEGLNQQFQTKEQQHAEKVAFVEEAQMKLTDQFKNLANEILEEKGKRFAEQNQNCLGILLNPLKTQLGEFKAKVESVYHQEGKDRMALQEQVKNLIGLNQMLSEDAKNLTTALKGNNKVQGNWGELILENILEASGLRRDMEFKVQASHTDEEGRRLQPDIVIQMPEGRSLVIDSKMSLNAYTDYIQAEEDVDIESALKRHVQSIRSHIKSLSSKNYQDIPDLKTLDFVVMFVPVESAFLLAVGRDADLYQDAWKHGVLLVSPSTLMFVLRTVEHLWRQEKHSQNAQEIAQRGAELYNKLCMFVDDLNKVETSLEAARTSFSDAKHRLVNQKGSVIRQAEMLIELGVKPSKRLPAGYSARQESMDSDTQEESTAIGEIFATPGALQAPAPRARRQRSDSALARCREIVVANIETSQPQDIKRQMVEETGINDNVANTYFSLVRREIEQRA